MRIPRLWQQKRTISWLKCTSKILQNLLYEALKQTGCAVCTPRFLTTLSKGEIKLKKRQSPKSGTALTERAKDVLFGYGLLLPTFLVFSIVILYPIISAVIRSFCDYTFLTVNKPLKWNDFANYKTIFKNGFLTQLWTTMKFTVGTVGIELVLGMSIALLLNTKIRGRNALRSVFLMPWCIPSIVTALLWSWLFQAQYGIINYVLYGLGLISNPTAEWVLNPSTSLGVVTIAVVWRQTPYMLVMILAGLQSINHDLVEAASIDGANSFRVFWHITLPGIRVVLGNTIITCIMASFQQFTIIYNMTAGGPLGKTTTLSIAAYKQAFTQLDLGVGSAICVIWMMLLGAAIAIYNMKTKRFDEL